MSGNGHPATGGGDVLRFDGQICFPLYVATKLPQPLYWPLLAPLGPTCSQYLVILLLWKHESSSIGALHDCLHLDIGSLSPLLKRMEWAGFVKRRRDARNKRHVLIALTAQRLFMRSQAKGILAALAALTGLKARGDRWLAGPSGAIHGATGGGPACPYPAPAKAVAR